MNRLTQTFALASATLALTSSITVGCGAPDATNARAHDGVVELACDDASSLGETLSSTGFFGEGVEPYDALASLWSDGADKQRFVKLPCDAQVDTSDVDGWIFPRGTTLWKEFSVEGQRVETRVARKVLDDDADPGAWEFSAYAWNDDETEAVKAVGGGTHDATGWSIPDADTCMECHANLKGRVIGFSALQLGHAQARGEGVVTLATLVDDGRLSHAPPTAAPAVHTWSDVAKKAQLALHASCAHCHRDGGQGAEHSTGVDANGASIPGLSLHVRYADSEATSGAARTAVNAPLAMPLSEEITMRIVAGEPSKSGLFHRMTTRGDWTQMPPLTTDIVDDEAAAAVSAWIDSL